MKQTASPLQPYSLKLCRGITAACAHAVIPTDIGPEIEGRVDASKWAQIHASSGKVAQHHTQLKIAVAACPNGCSQPQIVDFGLIATARLAIDPKSCTACGLCVERCAENALQLDDHIQLDTSRCLGCTACVRVCPTSALQISDLGYRVLVGGKLGRHPRLAQELGWHTKEEALDILSRVLDALCTNYRPGLRVKDILQETGADAFLGHSTV